MMALILICAQIQTCTPETAEQAIKYGHDFKTPADCFMTTMGYIAQSPLVEQFDNIKVECK